MKIAVIAPTEIPALRANTLQVMKMTQAFVQLGHDTHLASPYTGKTKPDLHITIDQPNSITWENLSTQYGIKDTFPILWFPAHNRLKRYDYGISSIRWARKSKVDLVYTRLPQAAAIASRLGMSTIFELHALPQGRIGRYLFKLFLNTKGARKLVLISRALAEDLRREFITPDHGKENLPSWQNKLINPSFTCIAPDGVDLERYEHVSGVQDARIKWMDRNNNLIPVNAFVAGYSGHLYPGRGIGVILSLAERLPEMIFLIIGGESGDVSKLQSRVIKRNLTNVVVTGFIANSQLPEYQAMCDVLLMPYQKQVAASSGGDIASYLSPMKLFEYLACGRAILSSNLPVLQEILDETNAILLDPQDIDAWAQALVELMNDPDTRNRLAAKAHQDAREYSWVSRASKILNGLG